jgi:hypothetical protein
MVHVTMARKRKRSLYGGPERAGDVCTVTGTRRERANGDRSRGTSPRLRERSFLKEVVEREVGSFRMKRRMVESDVGDLPLREQNERRQREATKGRPNPEFGRVLR